MSEGHHHRSMFKKPNKPFKGKSKGKVAKLNKGKVEAVAHRPGVKAATQDGNTKLNRLNHNRQLQKQKKEEILAKKRLGSKRGPPKTVALIPLSPNADLETLVRWTTGEEKQSPSNPRLRHIAPSEFSKHRFQLFACPRETHAILDAAKVADLCVFVLAPNDENDDLGLDLMSNHIITLLKTQGLGSVLSVQQGMSRVAPKKKQQYKKSCASFVSSAFEDMDKVVAVDSQADVGQLLRFLSNHKVKEVRWREQRSYLLAEEFKFVPNANGQNGTLSVSGYLRGPRPLSANQLIHVTGFGDYQISHIEGIPQTSSVSVSGDDEDVSMEGKKEESKKEGKKDRPAAPAPAVMSMSVLDLASAEHQESLEALNPIDTMAHEQSIITEEEIRLAEEQRKKEKEAKKSQAPGSVSAFQGLWDDLSDNEDEEGEGEGEKKSEAKIDEDVDETVMSIPTEKSKEEEEKEREEWLETQRLERDEHGNPDMVHVDPDVIAKDRFAKYRGLQNFKNSHWDPKESLPLEYSQIIQFGNFEATKRRVLSENVAGSGELRGVASEAPTPIIVHLVNVPIEAAKAICTTQSPIGLWPLFQYEHKVSVLHFLVRRHVDDTLPIKGKEPMEFHVGFRRFTARPIYSNHVSGAPKHMVERFFQPGRFSVASVYAHVMFPPANVLMFRGDPHNPSTLQTLDKNRFQPGAHRRDAVKTDDNADADTSIRDALLNAGLNPLVASGSLMSIDPDRMIIKRVILSGYPIFAHKNFAVVRYMFFRPDDIHWFKPVEIYTKRGLTGHIKEARGTKGYMKCTFNDHIQQNDTVCMNLYKRQFPPFDATKFQ